MAKKTAKKSDSWFNGNWKYIKWFWITFGIGIFTFLMLFVLASWGALGEMPTFEELENPKTNLATEVISIDGKVIGKYAYENRTPVFYKDLPENLVKALVSTEDQRYYSHSGIDARGTIRATAFLGTRGGASTITQQLSKLLFTGERNRGFVGRVKQKIKEWVISIRLERQYTKEELIAMYLNKMDFYFNAVGIQSASNIYFQKEPKDLLLEESAVLVAMLKNPRQFNPVREISMKKSLNRRNQVFVQMYKNGFLTEKEKDSFQKLPMKTSFSPQSHDEGMATYFRQYLRGFVSNWSRDNKKPDGSFYNIDRDGLKIYTTIDSKMQAYAEEAMQEHMPRLQAEFFHQNTPKRNPKAPFYDIEQPDINRIMESALRRSERWKKMKKEGIPEKEIRASFKRKTEMKVFSWKGDIDTIMTPLDSIRYYKHFLQTGVMSMEPQTGHVKVWVGGINFKHFKYDAVKQQKRQVGSTFKPFVYATAIDQLKLSPCQEYPNVQITIPANKYGNPEPWTPKNVGEKYGGMMTLTKGLATSTNTLTAKLMDMVGPRQVANLARRAGIKSEILPVPSIALGTPDISLFEMVGAYGMFANEGIYVKPVMVTRIEDKYGTVLYEFTPETRDVLSRESAYATVRLLEGVTRGGSGARLRHTGYDRHRADFREVVTGYPYKFDNPIAGKTGTTQNHSDGWFMGMVPNLVTGVWVGAEDRAARFASINYGQGGAMALPIWGLFMKKCYADKDLNVSKAEFKRPERMNINLDCKKQETDSIQVPKEVKEAEDLFGRP